MALTFNFGNMLDFNGNGQIDADERLVASGRVLNGFIGHEGVFQYGGSPPRYEYEWEVRAREEVRSEIRKEGGEVVVKVEGLLGGRRYELEKSEDLRTWGVEASHETAGKAEPEVRVSWEWREALEPGGRWYYRVKAVP